MDATKLSLLQLSISTVVLSMVAAPSGDDIYLNNITWYHGGEHTLFGPKERFHYCQRKRSGVVAHEIQDSHGAQADPTFPIVEVTPFMADFATDDPEEDAWNQGHIAFVNNPARTVSVLEPSVAGGCGMRTKVYVADMALENKCHLAVNAGFFDSATWGCLGNVVASGRLVRNSHGVQNAHFGIREDGALFFGYLTEEDVLDQSNPFVSLVGGVGWIIRDGKVYVDESMDAECGDTQETGTMDLFFSCKSGRMVIGSDREGRVVIAHVDGKTFIEGPSLRQFAVWLLKQGVVNAINLDGGGSSTYVVNGTMVNYPADICRGCSNTDLRYARRVSTILCVHEPKCVPDDCSGHGECVLGKCRCDDDWAEPDCSVLTNTMRHERNNSGGYIGDHLRDRSESSAKDCPGDQCSCRHLGRTSTLGHSAPRWPSPLPVGLYAFLEENDFRRLLEFVLRENNASATVVVLGTVSLISLALNVFLLCGPCPRQE